MRLEALNLGVHDAAERAALAKEHPEFTRENLQKEIDARTKELSRETSAAPATISEKSPQVYTPEEGEFVTWQDGEKTRTGQVKKIMASGRVKVRVSGKTDTDRVVTLDKATEFQPHTKEAKTVTHVVGRPKLDVTTDSLERAIRAKGGIKDDGSGELAALKRSGKPGLVTRDGMSREEMTHALRDDGYGRDVFTGTQHGSGIDPSAMIDAAIEDATGSRKHYSDHKEYDDVVPFARRTSTEPATGPLVTRDQTRLTVNQQGLDLLQKHGIFPEDVEGSTFSKGHAEIYADRLRQAAAENPADAKALRRLARQLTLAANEEQQGPIVMATPESLRHELGHEASDRATGLRPLTKKHTPAGFESLTSHRAWAQIKSGLTRLGYDASNRALAVEEAYAHIVEGRYDSLGIDRPTAIDWLDKWFTSLAEAGGDISETHFKELSDASNKIRERAAQARQGQPGPSSGAVRGVEAGREAGTGEDGAPAYNRPDEDLKTEPKYLGGRFFSQLYRTLVQKMPGRASVEQIRKIVENPQSGVKAEEVKWSGLDDFLKENRDATRKQVLDFLRANQMQMSEDVRGKGRIKTFEEWVADKNLGPDAIKEFGGSLRRSYDAFKESESQRDGGTKYGQYVVPGKAENYREILFTLPKKSVAQEQVELWPDARSL